MRLDVWMEAHQAPVGILDRRDDKSLSFTYVPGATADQRISRSLPVREAPYGDAACVAFFGNLLFEGRELDRVMTIHKLDRDDIGGLLYHLGADCPGAISVTPEGSGPGKRPGVFPDDYEILDSHRLLEIVCSLHFDGRLPANHRDPSPVAGVQPKLAMVVHNGQAYLPRANSRAPTTHILKVSPHDDPTLTRHESALMALARRSNLDVAETVHQVFHDPETQTHIDALLSTRFDRVFDGQHVSRIHSEDLCQALGLARQLKYERDAQGHDHRFSAAAVGQLASRTAEPGPFTLKFFQQTLFNLAVGNTDNHAKNATLLYSRANGVLAPLYDVVPVTLDSRVTHELAFLLGPARLTEDVTPDALMAAMRDLGFARPRLDKAWTKFLRSIAVDVPFLEEEGGKELADSVAAQLLILQGSLGVDLGIPQRDHYPRKVRDATVPGSRGGWTILS